MKIRHYGLLGNRNRQKKLTICKRLTGTAIVPKAQSSTLELVKKLTGKEVSLCPCCGSAQRARLPLLANTS